MISVRQEAAERAYARGWVPCKYKRHRADCPGACGLNYFWHFSLINGVFYSSWIDSLAYHGNFLVVFTSSETAIIYTGIPSWLKGLLAAGIRGKDIDCRAASIGRAYHRLVKNKYTGQLVNNPAKVQELRQLFK